MTHGCDLYIPCTPSGGVGVGLQSCSPVLKTVAGGKTSVLANGRDTETGWPKLSGLDITGQLTIDVPCVVERCRISNPPTTKMASGWYAVNNSQQLDCIIRDCEIIGPRGWNDQAVSAVVLYPRVMQRCVVSGGIDGIKIGNRIGTNEGFRFGCLIEDCFIHSQLTTYDAQGRISHNDGIQITGGTVGDWDAWMFRRCRIEGETKGAHGALMFQAESTGNVSGVTLQDCFFSGGPATVQTRQFSPYVFTKLQIRGCLWAKDTWTSQPLATSIMPDAWQENYLADVDNVSVNEPVTINKKYPFVVPKLVPTTGK